MNDDRHTPAMPNLGEGEWLDPQTCKQWREYSGISKAEYAAIHTGQPCSGTPWLDNMIRAQRRERLAGQALAGFAAIHTEPLHPQKTHVRRIVEASVMAADAFIAALEGGDK